MRIRCTKPEFWRSERIASVSWEDRLVLKGLESYVDDNGVGKDDLALIVADVFPRDLSRNPTETLRKVQEALHRLLEAGLIWRYEDEGTNLLYISFWESIQRIEKPSNGRMRRPDGTIAYRESLIASSIREGSGSIPVGLRPGTGEQGNRGTEDPCASADAERVADPLAADFADWYGAYPRKKAKGAAVKAYRAARKKASAEEIWQGLRRQLAEFKMRPIEKVPYPATWLNGECWADEAPSNVVPMVDIADLDLASLPPVESSWMRRPLT